MALEGLCEKTRWHSRNSRCLSCTLAQGSSREEKRSVALALLLVFTQRDKVKTEKKGSLAAQGLGNGKSQNMGLIKVVLVGGNREPMSGSRCANGLAKKQHLAAADGVMRPKLEHCTVAAILAASQETMWSDRMGVAEVQVKRM